MWKTIFPFIINGIRQLIFRTVNACMVPSLAHFPIYSFNHMELVDPSAMLFELPFIREYFRFYKKSLADDYVDYIKWNRLARSRTSFLFPYYGTSKPLMIVSVPVDLSYSSIGSIVTLRRDTIFMAWAIILSRYAC